MKIQEYGIKEILGYLGERTNGDRFTHRCAEKEYVPNSYGAVAYPESDTYYCFRCGEYGNTTKLIQEQNEYKTNVEVVDWAVKNLPDFEDSSDVIGLEDSYSAHFFTFVRAANTALKEREDVKEWLKKKYGITSDNIESYILGFVTPEVLASIPDNFKHELRLPNIINYVIIPLIENGVVVSVKARRCEPLFELDTKMPKYFNVSRSDTSPVPLFNYNGAKSALRKGLGDLAVLLICEGEFDAISLMRHTPYKAVVSVSAARSYSAHQRKQLAELSGLANVTIVIFDNDGVNIKGNAGQEGAIGLIEKMYKYGRDFKNYRLPLEENQSSIDITDYLLASENNASELMQAIVYTFRHSPTFLQQYIEDNRYGITKERVINGIYERVAMLPTSNHAGYIKQLSTPPPKTEGMSDATRNLLYIPRKVAEAGIKGMLKNLAKQDSTEIEFASADETLKKSLFYAQDYWRDAERGTYNAQKCVWSDIVTRHTEGGEERRVTARVPILVVTSTTEQGNMSVSYEAVNIYDLDRVRQMSIPNDSSLFSSYRPWSTTDSAPYSVNNFIKQQGNIDIDALALYEEIKGIFNQHIYFKDPAYADIITTYVFLSYIFMSINSLPYIWLTGEAGSGKTTLAMLMRKMSYGDCNNSLSNAANFYRTAHADRGLMVFDEEESLQNNGRSSDRDREVASLLRSSYNREGGMVCRQERMPNPLDPKTTVFGNQYFMCYNPKILISIKFVEAALASRLIEVQTKKIPVDLMHKYTALIEDTLEALAPKLQTIRDKLCIWSLTQHLLFKDAYKEGSTTLPDTELNNRDLELWLPLYAIAKSIGADEAALSIIDLAKRSITKRKTVIGNSDFVHAHVLFENIVSTFWESGKEFDVETGLFRWIVNGEVSLCAAVKTFPNVYRERLRVETGGNHKYVQEGSDAFKLFTRNNLVDDFMASRKLAKHNIGVSLGLGYNNKVYRINLEGLQEFIQAHKDREDKEGTTNE